MTTSVDDIDIELVHPHPRNPRRDLGDLAELTASIKDSGIRSPLHVLDDIEQDRYVVVAGHRRLAAAKAAGLKTVPAIVRRDVKTDADALVEMAVENLNRADLTPLEEAVLFEQLQIAGMKPTAIAKKTGRKKATVEARLALMTLPEPAREAVHDAQLSLEDAAAILEFADDEKTMADLTAVAGRSDFRWKLQEARNRRQHAARREESKAALQAAGVPIVKRPRDYWEHLLNRVVQLADREIEDFTEARRAAHAACPHHAAFIEDNGTITYLCTEPSVHRSGDREAPGSVTSTGDPKVDAAAAAAREAARAAEEQERQDCETAAGVRRQFIRDTVSGRRGVLSPASCTAIALAAAENLLEEELYGGNDDVETYLELTIPDGPSNGATWEEQRDHEDKVAGLIRDEAVRRGGHAALLALLAASREGNLNRPGVWSPTSSYLAPDSAGRRWIQLLVDLGYELTGWEAARVAAADTHALEQAAGDEQDDVDEDGDG